MAKNGKLTPAERRALQKFNQKFEKADLKNPKDVKKLNRSGRPIDKMIKKSGPAMSAEDRALARFNALVEKTNFDDPKSVRKLNNASASRAVGRMAAGKSIGAARALKAARMVATRAGNPLVGAALIAGPAIVNKLNKESKNTNKRPAKAEELRGAGAAYSKGGTPVRQVNKRMANGAVSDAAKMISPGRSPKNTKAGLDKAIKQYRQMLSKASKTNGKIEGMTKNQISNGLDQLLEQRSRMK